MHELAWMDATAQAELVRRGDATPQQLLDAAIKRIELVNPLINAVITTMFEDAYQAARSDILNGPFAGVPFLLKDLIALCNGSRIAAGSHLLGDYTATYDSELVRRYRQAGLNIIGKTNTSEFGILGTTEPGRFGQTRNPWDPSRSVGGSSGGSAAAVSAGLVPAAHASDAGGSIRIPASCCGIFGLKPTRARNPLGPDNGDLVSGLWVEHVVSRTVRDSARLLDVTGYPEPGEPYCAPPADRRFELEIARDPGRLRIAFSTASPLGGSVDSICEDATVDAAKLCASLGHHVSEASPGFDPDRFNAAFDTIWKAGIAWTMQHWAKVVGRQVGASDVELVTYALYELGLRVSACDYLEALHELQHISRSVASFFDSVDIWLTPTVSTAPPPLDWMTSTSDDPLRAYRLDGDFCPFTSVANVTGQPAMSVPLFWHEQLPIGTQFVGRYGEEGTLIRLAAQLEEARPWAARVPSAIDALYRSSAG